jgi:hypothetical protein
LSLGTILLGLHPVLGDLSHGNVNIVIAFFVLAALESYRRNWAVLSGIILALAITCKITPALFVPFFGWKWTLAIVDALRGRICWRRAITAPAARVLLGTVVGLLIWLFAVPGAIIGVKRNTQFLVSWYEVMAMPFLVDGKVTSEHANQSIPGWVTRLVTEAPSELVYDEDDRPVPGDYHNLVNWSPETARRIVQVCQVAWVLVVVLFAHQRVRQGPQFAAEVGFVLLGMLLFSERTWKHHAVVILLPMAVFLPLLLSASRPRWFVVSFALVAVLMVVPSAVGGEFQDEALAYGTHTVAFIIIAMMLAILFAGVSASVPGASESESPPAGCMRKGAGSATSDPQMSSEVTR